MRPAREIGATATLFERQCATRVHHPLEGVPEDLSRLDRRLPGIAQRVELERADPALEAKVGGISTTSIRH